MDDVLCDFMSEFRNGRRDNPDIEFPQGKVGFFEKLPPIPKAIDSVNRLREIADLYILSAPSVHNAHSYTEKRIWIENYFGYEFCDRLILSCHKNLLQGEFLIDDYESGKGQEGFRGELLVFGSDTFPDWDRVMSYLVPKLSV